PAWACLLLSLMEVGSDGDQVAASLLSPPLRLLGAIGIYVVVLFDMGSLHMSVKTLTPSVRPRRMSMQRRRIFLAYLFLSPALLGLITFLLIPLGWGIWISFTNFTPGVSSAFVGWENYIRVFNDQIVRAATLVVIKYALVVIPVLVTIPLLMAFPLNRVFPGIGIYRAGVYFPHIVSMVVVATMFIYIYRSDGIINQVLWRIAQAFGIELEPIAFLKSSQWALPAVIFVTVFKSCGYYAILYLAGL